MTAPTERGAGPRTRNVLHVLPHPGGGAETYVDLLEGMEGFAHRRLALSPTRSRVRGLVAVPARRRRVLRAAAGADLVHLHGDMAAMIAAPALAGRPLVITTHGLHRLRRTGGLAGRLLGRRLRAAVGAAARTICLTAEERRDLAAVLPPNLAGRLVEVPNGVPLPPEASAAQRAEARRALGLGESEVGVLFAGRLEERKDPLGAAAAVEAARARGAELVLLVAGEGPLEAQVQARQGAGVRALGQLADLEQAYTAAEIFLLPSHREGMSFALLEAMAHGLVPIVADGAGNAETVGEAGVVFAAGEVEAMAGALGELGSDAERRARLGEAARERIRSELSLERFRDGTRESYEAALARAPQGA